MNWNNEKEVLDMVGYNGLYLENVSNRLKENEEITRKAINNDCFALEFASKEFKNNKDIVRSAVIQDSLSFRYASNELKNDKEFVIELMNDKYFLESYNKNLFRHYKNFLYCISDELKNDKDIMLQIYSNKVFDKEETDCLMVKFLNTSTELKNDKDFVLDVITTLGPDSLFLKDIYQKLSYEFTNDFNFMLEVLKVDANAINYVSNELVDNEKFMLKAISEDYDMFNHASDELKNNKDFLVKAFKENELSFAYIVDSKGFNYDVFKEILKNDETCESLKFGTLDNEFKFNAIYDVVYENPSQLIHIQTAIDTNPNEYSQGVSNFINDLSSCNMKEFTTFKENHKEYFNENKGTSITD